jgi:hypothetical protein
MRNSQRKADQAWLRFSANPDFDWDKLTVPRVLSVFLSYSLERQRLEPIVAELEALHADAMAGGDLHGDFDFGDAVTAKWWEKFLSQNLSARKEWRKYRYTLDDLKAIQSPKSRQGK